MTQAEIEAVLTTVFNHCELADCALSDRQKEIIRESLTVLVNQFAGEQTEQNPLSELSPEHRQALLQFVQFHDEPDRSWKVHLLDDWLHGKDSGSVQFIRELYGPQWLERVQPKHLAEYADLENNEWIRVKVGDRIEVCNSLWEWVQQTGPCTREWFACTVINIQELSDQNSLHINCTVRFDNGSEYEMQGMYEWNRYNWRWPQND